MSTLEDESNQSDEQPHKNAAWLQQQYWENSRTLRDLAAECGVSEATILRWMRKHDIPRRDKSCTVPSDARYKDADWLEQQYWGEGLALRSIADECGVTLPTIRAWMDKHGIEIRAAYDAGAGLEDVRDREWLREQYLDAGKSTETIADECGVSASTVFRWLAHHDIPARSRSESLSGDRHPNWKGGVDDFYGASWPRQRRRAIERDDEQCVACSMTREQHREQFGQGLHVHHIRPFRRFGVENHEQANQLDNLVTLCRRCHDRWEGIPLRPEVADD